MTDDYHLCGDYSDGAFRHAYANYIMAGVMAGQPNSYSQQVEVTFSSSGYHRPRSLYFNTQYSTAAADVDNNHPWKYSDGFLYFHDPICPGKCLLSHLHPSLELLR